eukprot:jgi/Mesvir1/17880/Mv12956-RA.1
MNNLGSQGNGAPRPGVPWGGTPHNGFAYNPAAPPVPSPYGFVGTPQVPPGTFAPPFAACSSQGFWQNAPSAVGPPYYQVPAVQPPPTTGWPPRPDSPWQGRALPGQRGQGQQFSTQRLIRHKQQHAPQQAAREPRHPPGPPDPVAANAEYFCPPAVPPPSSNIPATSERLDLFVEQEWRKLVVQRQHVSLPELAYQAFTQRERDIPTAADAPPGVDAPHRPTLAAVQELIRDVRALSLLRDVDAWVACQLVCALASPGVHVSTLHEVERSILGAAQGHLNTWRNGRAVAWSPEHDDCAGQSDSNRHGKCGGLGNDTGDGDDAGAWDGHIGGAIAWVAARVQCWRPHDNVTVLVTVPAKSKRWWKHAGASSDASVAGRHQVACELGWEDLGLGPLLRHPLVRARFQLTDADMAAVAGPPPITTAHVLMCLDAYVTAGRMSEGGDGSDGKEGMGMRGGGSGGGHCRDDGGPPGGVACGAVESLPVAAAKGKAEAHFLRYLAKWWQSECGKEDRDRGSRQREGRDGSAGLCEPQLFVMVENVRSLAKHLEAARGRAMEDIRRNARFRSVKASAKQAKGGSNHSGRKKKAAAGASRKRSSSSDSDSSSSSSSSGSDSSAGGSSDSSDSSDNSDSSDSSDNGSRSDDSSSSSAGKKMVGKKMVGKKMVGKKMVGKRLLGAAKKALGKAMAEKIRRDEEGLFFRGVAPPGGSHAARLAVAGIRPGTGSGGSPSTNTPGRSQSGGASPQRFRKKRKMSDRSAPPAGGCETRLQEPGGITASNAYVVMGHPLLPHSSSKTRKAILAFAHAVRRACGDDRCFPVQICHLMAPSLWLLRARPLHKKKHKRDVDLLGLLMSREMGRNLLRMLAGAVRQGLWDATPEAPDQARAAVRAPSGGKSCAQAGQGDATTASQRKRAANPNQGDTVDEDPQDKSRMVTPNPDGDQGSAVRVVGAIAATAASSAAGMAGRSRVVVHVPDGAGGGKQPPSLSCTPGTPQGSNGADPASSLGRTAPPTHGREPVGQSGPPGASAGILQGGPVDGSTLPAEATQVDACIQISEDELTQLVEAWLLKAQVLSGWEESQLEAPAPSTHLLPSYASQATPRGAGTIQDGSYWYRASLQGGLGGPQAQPSVHGMPPPAMPPCGPATVGGVVAALALLQRMEKSLMNEVAVLASITHRHAVDMPRPSPQSATSTVTTHGVRDATTPHRAGAHTHPPAPPSFASLGHGSLPDFLFQRLHRLGPALTSCCAPASERMPDAADVSAFVAQAVAAVSAEDTQGQGQEKKTKSGQWPWEGGDLGQGMGGDLCAWVDASPSQRRGGEPAQGDLLSVEVERRLCQHYRVGRTPDLGHGDMQHLLARAWCMPAVPPGVGVPVAGADRAWDATHMQKRPADAASARTWQGQRAGVPRASQGWGRVVYILPALVSSLPATLPTASSARGDDAAAPSFPGTGAGHPPSPALRKMARHVSLDTALQALASVPPLQDLEASAMWPCLFQPSLGPLRLFLRRTARVRASMGLAVAELPHGVLVRLVADASMDTLAAAVCAGDAPGAVHQLVALLAYAGGDRRVPYSALGERVSMALFALLASAGEAGRDAPPALLPNSTGVVVVPADPAPHLAWQRDTTALPSPSHGAMRLEHRATATSPATTRGLPGSSSLDASNELAPGPLRVVRFLLACLVEAPPLVRPFVTRVLLPPAETLLAPEVGGRRAVVRTCLLRACVGAGERSALHATGLALDIEEWMEDLACHMARREDDKSKGSEDGGKDGGKQGAGGLVQGGMELGCLPRADGEDDSVAVSWPAVPNQARAGSDPVPIDEPCDVGGGGTAGVADDSSQMVVVLSEGGDVAGQVAVSQHLLDNKEGTRSGDVRQMAPPEDVCMSPQGPGGHASVARGAKDSAAGLVVPGRGALTPGSTFPQATRGASVSVETADANIMSESRLLEGGPAQVEVGDAARLEEAARAVVARILEEEFGVTGAQVSNRSAGDAPLSTSPGGVRPLLLSKQHERIGRALQRLSQDLYTSGAHFLLELMQNADDNAYTRLGHGEGWLGRPQMAVDAMPVPSSLAHTPSLSSMPSLSIPSSSMGARGPEAAGLPLTAAMDMPGAASPPLPAALPWPSSLRHSLLCPALVFVIWGWGLELFNNEDGFRERDVRALCDVGRSTKVAEGAGSPDSDSEREHTGRMRASGNGSAGNGGDGSSIHGTGNSIGASGGSGGSSGRGGSGGGGAVALRRSHMRRACIGRKGIGWKSVFQVSDAPEVHSNGYRLRFDVTRGSIGYIMPTWVDAPRPNGEEGEEGAKDGGRRGTMDGFAGPSALQGCTEGALHILDKATLAALALPAPQRQRAVDTRHGQGWGGGDEPPGGGRGCAARAIGVTSDVGSADARINIPTSSSPHPAALDTPAGNRRLAAWRHAWRTRMVLPYRASLRETQADRAVMGASATTGHASAGDSGGAGLVSAKLRDLSPCVLLFLHRLRCLVVADQTQGWQRVLRRYDVGAGGSMVAGGGTNAAHGDAQAGVHDGTDGVDGSGRVDGDGGSNGDDGSCGGVVILQEGDEPGSPWLVEREMLDALGTDTGNVLASTEGTQALGLGHSGADASRQPRAAVEVAVAFPVQWLWQGLGLEMLAAGGRDKDARPHVSTQQASTSPLVASQTGGNCAPNTQVTAVVDHPPCRPLPSPRLAPQSVFAFLPLRHFGLRFLLHADFDVPSSREDVLEDSGLNQHIRAHVPRLLMRSLMRFLRLGRDAAGQQGRRLGGLPLAAAPKYLGHDAARSDDPTHHRDLDALVATGCGCSVPGCQRGDAQARVAAGDTSSVGRWCPSCLDHAALMADGFLHFMPLEGDTLGFLAALPAAIHHQLRAVPCLPVDAYVGSQSPSPCVKDETLVPPGPFWVRPEGALAGADASLKELVPPAQLQHLMGLHYLHPRVALRPALWDALGVASVTAPLLVDLTYALCAEEQGRRLRARGQVWLARWLLLLDRYLTGGAGQGTAFSGNQSLPSGWRPPPDAASSSSPVLLLALRALPLVPLLTPGTGDVPCNQEKGPMVLGSPRELPIFLPPEEQEDVLGDPTAPPGSVPSHGAATRRPLRLLADVRLVDPRFLSCLDVPPRAPLPPATGGSTTRSEAMGEQASGVAGMPADGAGEATVGQPSLREILVRLLGVRPLSSHQIVMHHILPAFARAHAQLRGAEEGPAGQQQAMVQPVADGSSVDGVKGSRLGDAGGQAPSPVLLGRAELSRLRATLVGYLGYMRKHLAVCSLCQGGDTLLRQLQAHAVVAVAGGGLRPLGDGLPSVRFPPSLGNTVDLPTLFGQQLAEANVLDADAYLQPHRSGGDGRQCDEVARGSRDASNGTADTATGSTGIVGDTAAWRHLFARLGVVDLFHVRRAVVEVADVAQGPWREHAGQWLARASVVEAQACGGGVRVSGKLGPGRRGCVVDGDAGESSARPPRFVVHDWVCDEFVQLVKPWSKAGFGPSGHASHAPGGQEQAVAGMRALASAVSAQWARTFRRFVNATVYLMTEDGVGGRTRVTDGNAHLDRSVSDASGQLSWEAPSSFLLALQCTGWLVVELPRSLAWREVGDGASNNSDDHNNADDQNNAGVPISNSMIAQDACGREGVGKGGEGDGWLSAGRAGSAPAGEAGPGPRMETGSPAAAMPVGSQGDGGHVPLVSHPGGRYALCRPTSLFLPGAAQVEQLLGANACYLPPEISEPSLRAALRPLDHVTPQHALEHLRRWSRGVPVASMQALLDASAHADARRGPQESSSADAAVPFTASVPQMTRLYQFLFDSLCDEEEEEEEEEEENVGTAHGSAGPAEGPAPASAHSPRAMDMEYGTSDEGTEPVSRGSQEGTSGGPDGSDGSGPPKHRHGTQRHMPGKGEVAGITRAELMAVLARERSIFLPCPTHARAAASPPTGNSSSAGPAAVGVVPATTTAPRSQQIPAVSPTLRAPSWQEALPGGSQQQQRWARQARQGGLVAQDGMHGGHFDTLYSQSERTSWPDSLVPGAMWRAEDVCWEDPSGVHWLALMQGHGGVTHKGARTRDNGGAPVGAQGPLCFCNYAATGGAVQPVRNAPIQGANVMGGLPRAPGVPVTQGGGVKGLLREIGKVYPSLRDLFVDAADVSLRPSFEAYLQALHLAARQLSPTTMADALAAVLRMWARFPPGGLSESQLERLRQSPVFPSTTGRFLRPAGDALFVCDDSTLLPLASAPPSSSRVPILLLRNGVGPDATSSHRDRPDMTSALSLGDEERDGGCLLAFLTRLGIRPMSQVGTRRKGVTFWGACHGAAGGGMRGLVGCTLGSLEGARLSIVLGVQWPVDHISIIIMCSFQACGKLAKVS